MREIERKREREREKERTVLCVPSELLQGSCHDSDKAGSYDSEMTRIKPAA
jgi:hypothetical protein